MTRDMANLVKGTMSVKKFSQIPESVQAAQFTGWESATDIFSWVDGIMYVGRGYPHKLRNTEEFDRKSGALLEGAQEFLVFKNAEGEYRLDLYFWIVKRPNEDVVIYLDDVFKKTYSEDNY